MVRVLVTDGMNKDSIAVLRDSGYEVVEQFYGPDELGTALQEYDVVVVRSATKIRQAIIDKALETGRLKLIIRGGVGVDNIDVGYATSKGIRVANTPNSSSASVAELALAHMFAVCRFVNISNVTMREGRWEKKKYNGIELGGKTIGLVGFGKISKSLAEKASALGMKVIYTNRHGKVEGYDQYEYCTLNQLISKSDFVSLHIPFIKEQGVVIGKEQFDMMKDGAVLINCARGGVVDEAALLEALDNGKLRGAGVDVFEVEPATNTALINHPRVSVTPHIGAATKEAQTRIGAEIVQVIFDFFNE